MGIPFIPLDYSYNFNVFLKLYQNKKLNLKKKRNVLLHNPWFIEVTKEVKKCFNLNDKNTTCRMQVKKNIEGDFKNFKSIALNSHLKTSDKEHSLSPQRHTIEGIKQ